MEILRLLGTSERPVSEVLQGLDVVRTLLGNIVRDPGEQRFRSIRKANSRIAALLGREEEGLLRAAGFDDNGEVFSFSSSRGSSDVADRDEEVDSEACIREVLDAVEVACKVLRRHLEEAVVGLELRCLDEGVSRALDCTLLDHVGQRSAEVAERHKRRRIAAEAEAVRSAKGWREVFQRLDDGRFVLDAGPLEDWLANDSSHRVLAHDLLQLQAAAVRWYGDGARCYCDEWRQRVCAKNLPTIEANADAAGGPVVDTFRYGSLFQEELQRLREALFEFPEQPGATPVLFRSVMKSQVHDVSTSQPGESLDESEADGAIVMETPRPEQTETKDVVALE